MPRSLSCLALVVLGAIQFGGTASFAQRPPSERELRIYAGLHDAAARGDVVETERLIREGEKPNIQDANSRTPLHVAAFLRQHAAARALLRLGANANALDAQRYDILTIAAVNDDLEMVNIALEEIVRALIAAKAPLNHVNDLGRTASGGRARQRRR